MVSNGQISADTMVWTEGMSTWTPYRDAFSMHGNHMPSPSETFVGTAPYKGKENNKQGKKKIAFIATGAVVAWMICFVGVNTWLMPPKVERDFRKGISYLTMFPDPLLSDDVLNKALVRSREINEEEALPYIRDAAMAGHMNAMYVYAILLEKDDNMSEAMVWYKKAANMGHIKAMKNLCFMLQHGKGFHSGYNVNPDNEKAIKLAKKLYKKGVIYHGREIHAQVAKELNLPEEIGSAMEEYVIHVDKKYADKLKKLADEGDAMAAFLYARVRDLNRKEAKKYLTKAASKGHMEAKQYISIDYRPAQEKDRLQLEKELYDNGLLGIYSIGHYLKESK